MVDISMPYDSCGGQDARMDDFLDMVFRTQVFSFHKELADK